MFYIGEFSKMGKTTIKTLHHYDRIGLLHPEAVDGATGYRLYTTRQLAELHRIQSLRQAGLSVEEVAAIVAGADAQPILARRRDEIERELATRQDRLARIAFMIDNQEKGYCMDYQATIKELPSCVVFSKVMTVPDYSCLLYTSFRAFSRSLSPDGTATARFGTLKPTVRLDVPRQLQPTSSRWRPRGRRVRRATRGNGWAHIRQRQD